MTGPEEQGARPRGAGTSRRPGGQLGRYPRSIAVLTSGTVAGQMITLLASPLLTRLYGPAEWGVYGVLLSVFAIALVTVCLRYEVAIPAAADEREVVALVTLSFGLALLLSLLLPAGLVLLQALRPGTIPGLASAVLWLLVPLLLLNASWVILRYALLRREAFGPVARTQVLQSAGRVGAQGGFGLAGAGWIGLYAGEIVGRALAVGSFLRSAIPAMGPHRSGLSRTEVFAAARRHRPFALLGLPSSLVDVLAAQLPVPLLAGIYGREAAGSFALVQRVVALPMGLIGANVADAFHARLAAYARENPARCSRLFWRTAGVLAAIGVIPAILLLGFARPLFTVVFGGEWTLAGEMARLLVPWVFLQLVISPLSRLVFVLGGQAPKLIYDFAALLAVVGVLTAARLGAYPLLDAIRLLAWAVASCYVLYFLVLLWILRRWTARVR